MLLLIYAFTFANIQICLCCCSYAFTCLAKDPTYLARVMNDAQPLTNTAEVLGRKDRILLRHNSKNLTCNSFPIPVTAINRKRIASLN